MSRRCAVLGSPIAHSLSPTVHRAAYAELGLDWSYDAIDVTPAELAGFLQALGPEWRGLSLTMPLKRAVQPLLDEVTDPVRLLAAANTVLLADDGRRAGHNTDLPGMVAALRRREVTSVDEALVLGAGATAGAAAAALAELGASRVVAYARDPARGGGLRQLLARLDVEAAIRPMSALDDGGRVDVVVSTLPAEAAADLAPVAATRGRVVFDVAYDPWPPPLTRVAVAAGRVVIDGVDLLVAQAARQVELMTGRPAPVAAMDRAARARHPVVAA